MALGGGGGERERGIVVPFKTRIEQGQYEVDVRRVADAILARIMVPAVALPAAANPHSACSKPVSSPSASTKTAAG